MRRPLPSPTLRLPALPPPPLQAHYRDHGKYHFARSVLVLHNVAHQGRGPMDDLRLLEVPEQYKELFRWAVRVAGALQYRRQQVSQLHHRQRGACWLAGWLLGWELQL